MDQLSGLFPSLQRVAQRPVRGEGTAVYYDAASDSWLVIREDEVSERDHALLAAVYEEVRNAAYNMKDPEQMKWLAYLNGTGAPPLAAGEGDSIRAVHLSFAGGGFDAEALREAAGTFFGGAMVLLVPGGERAVLIERKGNYVYELEDFQSFAAVLEGDFFLKPALYIGKFHAPDEGYPETYRAEAAFFTQGMGLLPKERLLTMEKVFPELLVRSLPDSLTAMIRREILLPAGPEEELLKTVRSFFENGFNGSTTAEKLYIHRNTLNYRLSKFQDITGVSVRSFSGALVAYVASLMAAGQE